MRKKESCTELLYVFYDPQTDLIFLVISHLLKLVKKKKRRKALDHQCTVRSYAQKGSVKHKTTGLFTWKLISIIIPVKHHFYIAPTSEQSNFKKILNFKKIKALISLNECAKFVRTIVKNLWIISRPISSRKTYFLLPSLTCMPV